MYEEDSSTDKASHKAQPEVSPVMLYKFGSCISYYLLCLKKKKKSSVAKAKGETVVKAANIKNATARMC